MAEPQLISRPATLENVRRLANHVRRRCAEERLDEVLTMDFELAVVEAANNVVIHGYAGSHGSISVSLNRAVGGVEVTIEDRGAPMPLLPGAVAAHSPTAESGRGLAIIYACTDRVCYASDNGVNRLTLFKAIPAG